MIKIGFDAGHGLNTPGKRTPDGEPEWTFNNKVARAFANELALYKGVMSKRFDDPTGRRDVPLIERTNGANNWGANYYISFHHNALASVWGEHTGVETFIYTTPKPKSTEFANAIHPALVQSYGLRNRGIKKANLHIVRETNMPAILVEGGFMDSTIDIKKLRNNQVLENVGKAIAQALARFVGLERAIPDGEEGLTVSQYEELKQRIANLEGQLANKADITANRNRVDPNFKNDWDWAIANGIFRGDGNNMNPGGAITREQMASILKRYHDTFIANNNEVSANHKEAWEKLTSQGITDGSKPRALATREQVVDMLNRAINEK